ncbi:MAG: MarR family transcriptional regulator, partial [Chloroflexi bacterium]|nr:MarR family transcriptional regulator [Chloroflexota bacterium]
SDDVKTGSPPAEDPLARPLTFYISRTYHYFLGLVERLLEESGLAGHVRPGMAPILFTLYAQDDLIIKEIGRRAKLSHATLTGMLGKMEKAGLIRRKRCAADGRAVRVRLTALGRSMEPALREMTRKLHDVLHDGLRDEDVDQTLEAFNNGLDTIIEDGVAPLRT